MLGLSDHLRLHDVRELADDDGEERPPREGADVTQADAAPTEVGTDVELGALPEEQQHDRLQRDTEGRGAAQQRDHARGPVADLGVWTAEDDEEDDEARDRYEVVDRGCPAVGTEHPSGVERLAEQGVEAVEQQLRQ